MITNYLTTGSWTKPIANSDLWPKTCDWTVRYVIAIVLVYAGFAKAFNPRDLGGVLLFDGFPLRLLDPMIWMIVFAETLLGVALMSEYGAVYTRKIAIALFILFTIQLCYLLLFKEPPKCGCPSLMKAYLSNRQAAMFGIVRNAFFLTVLFCSRAPEKALLPEARAISVAA